MKGMWWLAQSPEPFNEGQMIIRLHLMSRDSFILDVVPTVGEAANKLFGISKSEVRRNGVWSNDKHCKDPDAPLPFFQDLAIMRRSKKGREMRFIMLEDECLRGDANSWLSLWELKEAEHERRRMVELGRRAPALLNTKEVWV